MTDVVAIDAHAPDPATVERAASVLRDGGLVGFPTETVYGLGALVSDRGALRRVFAAKGRPATDPLIVHVSATDEAERVASAWPGPAAALADAFWPGPLTLVLPRRTWVPDEVTAGGSTVGVRVPAHPVALALIAAVGAPVAAPSANRFGRVSPTDAAHVIDELDGAIDLVVDAGPTPLGIESTVVDLTSSRPLVLRHGGITIEELVEVVGPLDAVERQVVADDTAAAAPGQLLRHYAPATPLVLVEGGEAVLAELVAALVERGVAAHPVAFPETADAAAPELYRALRRADGSTAELLLAAAFDGAGVGRALNDRLFRAARGRVVTDAAAATVARVRRWAERR